MTPKTPVHLTPEGPPRRRKSQAAILKHLRPPAARKAGRPVIMMSCRWGCGTDLPAGQIGLHETHCKKRKREMLPQRVRR